MMIEEKTETAGGPAKGGDQPSMTDLPGRLRALREAFNESQNDVALIAGVSRAAVSQWEAGKSEPEAAKMMKLAEHYRVAYEWLQFGKGQAPNLTVRSRYLAAGGNKTRRPRPNAPEEMRITIDLQAMPVPEVDTERQWHLPASVITEHLRAKPDNLCVWRAPSDFPPEVKRGDFLILDKGAAFPAAGMWCVQVDDDKEIMRARYRHTDGTPVRELVSKDDFALSPDKCKVVGKIVGALTIF